MDVAKIGVTGPKGRLGSELVRRGCMPLGYNVTNPIAVQGALAKANLDVMIHCAAFTDVDKCEHRPGFAAFVNTYGTHTLAKAFPGPIVYLATDYIFDGLDGPYDENAKPNPLNIYGWSKLGGEIVVRSRGNGDDLIVRTTILFDKQSDNFVTVVVRKLLSGETVTLPDDLYGTPTYVPDLADGILAAVQDELGGIVNLAGGLLGSRYQIGLWIADELGIDRTRVRPSNNHSTNGAMRPKRAGLKVATARSMGLPVGDPVEAIREVCKYALETMEAG